jgi:DNA helicase-2/ATP-dependent DNA helicase PcrA
MRLIADFHVHSHYSVATSKELTPENLELWARRKGIHIVGTGDAFHPGWYEDLKEKLIPAEDGLFALKEEYRLRDELFTSQAAPPVRFILSGEISSIYKHLGRVRKVHNLILCSSFDTVKRIQTVLESVGNIRSDGRPILGITSRDLLEISLEAGGDAAFIPAHIWTPWFSVLGAKSGYDTIEECFGDLSREIFALETGLSSDPPMNWLCSFLDGYTLISNSDAHSPEKLGREANLFDAALTYSSIISAMTGKGDQRFLGTIEFFPQEGKYHLDGHRKCGICWTPQETLRHGGICPVCGKAVTVGVLNRVMQLADRRDPERRANRHNYFSLTPLKNLIAEMRGISPDSKGVHREYEQLIKRGGPEFSLLLELPYERIMEVADEILAEGIRRIRSGEVYIEEGYDGKFGSIRAFQRGEVQSLSSQMSFFDRSFKTPERVARAAEGLEVQGLQQRHSRPGRTGEERLDVLRGFAVNPAQQQAVDHFTGPCLILAGPGTGKTLTLTMRIVRLIEQRGIDPASILAITFTNKAAEEMRKRITNAVKTDIMAQGITITTFHSFGMALLREYAHTFGRSSGFALFGDEEKAYILSSSLGVRQRDIRLISEMISLAKGRMQLPQGLEGDEFDDLYNAYEGALMSNDAFDIDDLVVYPVRLLRDNPGIGRIVRARYPWICIDEYQDINCTQYNLIRFLAPDSDSNLFAIGDPDQAIYGFRGADHTFIGRFKEDYPTAAIHELRTSYRCSQTILEASAHVMGSHRRGDVLEGLEQGLAVHIQRCATAKSEAEFVARTIERLMGGVRFFSIDSQITDGSDDGEERSFSDFGVLFRVSKMAPLIIKAFNDHGIPYQLVGEEPYYKQEPMSTIVDILRLIATWPFDAVLFQRLQDKRIRGMSESTLTELREKTADATVEGSIVEIVKAFFPQAMEEHRDSIERLLSVAGEYGSQVSSFLSFLQLGSPADTYIRTSEQVALMTMHAAKGLEFSYVFIIGCEDGIVPYTLFEKESSDIEEEKRILYVGMTRAKKSLFLSHAKTRSLFGKNFSLPFSPFLLEIKDELIKRGEAEKGRKKQRDDQLSLFA